MSHPDRKADMIRSSSNLSRPLIVTAIVAAVLGGIVGGVLGNLPLGATAGAATRGGAPALRASPPVLAEANSTTVPETAINRALVSAPKAQLQLIHESLNIVGHLAVDGARIHQASSRLPGRVDRLSIVEGAVVRAGEPIAWLYSPEFISAQSELLLARNTVRALDHRATADLLDDARATLQGARQRLLILGATQADIDAVENTGTVRQHLVVTAPISGRVLKRNLDPGAYLDAGASVATIADLSRLWFLGNIYDNDLPRIREGQIVDVLPGSADGNTPLRGRLSFISPVVDPTTHTISVRVELPNPGGRLKPEMFARGVIDMADRKLPVIPRAAVVQDGAQSFVVIERASNQYERVPVNVIPANRADEVAVLSGVSAGDAVVVEGSVLLDRAITAPPPSRAVRPQGS